MLNVVYQDTRELLIVYTIEKDQLLSDLNYEAEFEHDVKEIDKIKVIVRIDN